MDDYEDDINYYFDSDEELIEFILNSTKEEIKEKLYEIRGYAGKYEDDFLRPQHSQEGLEAYKRLSEINLEYLKKLTSKESFLKSEKLDNEVFFVDQLLILILAMKYINAIDTIFGIAQKTKNDLILDTCLMIVNSFVNSANYMTVEPKSPKLEFYFSLYPSHKSKKAALSFVKKIEEGVDSLLKVGRENENGSLIQKCGISKMLLTLTITTMESAILKK